MYYSPDAQPPNAMPIRVANTTTPMVTPASDAGKYSLTINA